MFQYFSVAAHWSKNHCHKQAPSQLILLFYFVLLFLVLFCYIINITLTTLIIFRESKKECTNSMKQINKKC